MEAAYAMKSDPVKIAGTVSDKDINAKASNYRAVRVRVMVMVRVRSRRG